MKSNTKK